MQSFASVGFRVGYLAIGYVFSGAGNRAVSFPSFRRYAKSNESLPSSWHDTRRIHCICRSHLSVFALQDRGCPSGGASVRMQISGFNNAACPPRYAERS